MTLLGTVEMGGTKVDVAVGTSPDDIGGRQRIPTTDPDTTLSAVIEYFSDRPVSALGVACFGPLDLESRSRRFGTMLATPKPGWTGTHVYDILSEEIDSPVVLDTDVNGAALGEGRWGATQGMESFAYVTVGTGIGAGVVVNGDTIRSPRHPEAGHIPVSRLEGDRFEGRCPYHGDCLEGMAAGPALEARFGEPSTWAGNETVVTTAAHYLAQGMQALLYTAGPERIVVGGGVSTLPWFHDRIRTKLDSLLAGYPTEPDLDLLISPPALGDLSGLAGGLVLASTAL